MNIAVIGDYDSSFYPVFLEIVKASRSEEHVLDLSKHRSNNTNKYRNDRQNEINSCHQVVIASDWRQSIEARKDITVSMTANKEMFAYVNNQFIPWEIYCSSR
jgi:hypothetical protein